MKWSDHLVEADFRDHWVWREISAEPGEFGWKMRPALKLPVSSLINCWVGTSCRLAGGEERFLVLRFVDHRTPLFNRHFTTLISFVTGRQVQLRRYHSLDEEAVSPQRFADALGLSPEQVFPVRYDLTSIAKGHPDALRGAIQEPMEQMLTEDELIGLTLSSLEIGEDGDGR